MTTATPFVPAAAALVVVSLAALIVGSSGCGNVASMNWDDACLKSCNKPEWYRLCHDTLRNAPNPAELTVFALIATRAAKLKYDATLDAIDQMLGAGNLPAGEKAAVSHCKSKYLEARKLMAAVADQMFACDFSSARQEYLDAQTDVNVCQSDLWSYQFLPLFSMVSSDLDLTMVAYELGALIVGR
ncbi:hypothetical protein ACP4OV_031983 [Aristida adscensionis]